MVSAKVWGQHELIHRIDVLMQKGRNSSALAMELRLFCIKPSECTAWYIYMVVLCFAISSFRVVSNDIVSHIQSYSVASLALENMHNWVPDLLECTVYLVHFSGSWYNCAYLSWDAFERGNRFMSCFIHITLYITNIISRLHIFSTTS